MKRDTFPPEFIEALLETAERAKIGDKEFPNLLAGLLQLNGEALQPAGKAEMLEMLSSLCWLITDAEGWFYGPGGQY